VKTIPADLTKKIVVPVDGSGNSLRSLEYLDLIYGPKHNLDVILFYVLPSLPSVLTDERIKDKKVLADLGNVEEKNISMAERLLTEARTSLMVKGFREEKVNALYQKREITVPQDICYWARTRDTDAILLGRRGKTDLQAFFMGEVSDRLVECCEGQPVWIMGGKIRSNKVLVCVDASRNALKAVEHVGFMLSETDCAVTIFHAMISLRGFVPVEVLEEADELQRLWGEKAGQQIAPFMERAREILLNAGLAKEQIAIKVVNGSQSPAYDILQEALDEGYGTIVLGRRGLSIMKEFLLGSITKKVLLSLSDLAIWIVH